MDEFPPNSHKSKEEKPEPDKKVVEKVIDGAAVEKKKSFGYKVKQVFVGADVKNATHYILSDVVLPMLRNMIVEAGSKGLERVIYGENAPRNMQAGRRSGGRVMYNSPVNRMAPQQQAFLPGQNSNVQSRRQDIADICLISREDAEAVVQGLGNLIAEWGQASVSDLKNLVGIPATFVDEGWGWESLYQIQIRQTRDGYLLDLPPVMPL